MKHLLILLSFTIMSASYALAQEVKTPDVVASLDPFIEALSHVYSKHPQLNAQRESLKATDEGVAQAISGFRPSIAASLSGGREKRETNKTGESIATTKAKSLEITQPLFNGGETLASFASAKDRVKAGRAELVALEERILLQAIIAYTNVVNNQSILEVNQNNVDLLDKQLKATKARFDVGQLTQTDVAQSQSRLATAQSAERQALGDLETAKATFRRVIGYDSPATLELPSLPRELPENLEKAIEIAQTNEPTLEAARHLENAAANDVDIKTARIFPDIALQGTLERRTNPSVSNLRSDSDSLMLNMTIPLYQSGAEWSRIREAENKAQEAKFSTMDIKDAVIENVSRAWQDYNTAKAVITSREEALKAATTALDAIQQENKYGSRTILDVLNTQQDLITAQVSLVNAKVNEKQAAYRLLASVGNLTADNLNLLVNLNNPKQHYDDVKYKLIGF
jgi:outer membrane protein